MKRVLVTGGAGYIGSHACKQLAQEGIEPVVFDNLSRGHRDAVKWGPLVVGDLHDTMFLLETMKTYQPSAVIHFAALSYVGESVEHPNLYYTNNVAGTLSLLHAMKLADVRHFVLSSTCAVYGEPTALPISEETPRNPVNPYGRSKFFIEEMLDDYATAQGLNYVALRYYNACGADQDGEAGERHDPETHLIPRATDGGGWRDQPSRRLRHRLRHAGRHVYSRLYPRVRPGGGPLPGARTIWTRTHRGPPSTWGSGRACPSIRYSTPSSA